MSFTPIVRVMSFSIAMSVSWSNQSRTVPERVIGLDPSAWCRMNIRHDHIHEEMTRVGIRGVLDFQGVCPQISNLAVFEKAEYGF